MRAGSSLVASLAAALAATAARADAPAPHRHAGLHLRLDAGVGYAEQREPLPGGDLKMSGVAAELGVSVGGALQEDLVLAGHAFGLVLPSPAVSVGGAGSGGVSVTSLVGVGPQLTYYFMPADVWIAATLALTRVQLRAGGADAHSRWGGGLQLAAGKDWRVSSGWAAGVAAELFGSKNEDQGANAATLTTWGAALVATASHD